MGTTRPVRLARLAVVLGPLALAPALVPGLVVPPGSSPSRAVSHSAPRRFLASSSRSVAVSSHPFDDDDQRRRRAGLVGPRSSHATEPQEERATSPTPEKKPPLDDISTEWELDCFSRPVITDGKKLWEVLVTDSTGKWREVYTLPASQVNSVSVRRAVEAIIAKAPVKPTVIRFFRRQMRNMLSIALNGVASSRAGLRVVPSRATHSVIAWLREREATVYPEMPGYDTSLASSKLSDRPAALAGAASRLPEGLRGEQFAFLTLPLEEVLPGGSITANNVGCGKLIDPTPWVASSSDDDDEVPMLPGVALLSRRADPLAMSLAAVELAGARADPSTRQLVLDVGLDDSYLLAKLDDLQRQEAAAFEKAKARLNGLHFVVVQRPTDSEVEPAAFWLLRDIE